jgi:hypothetical protein
MSEGAEGEGCRRCRGSWPEVAEANDGRAFLSRKQPESCMNAPSPCRCATPSLTAPPLSPNDAAECFSHPELSALGAPYALARLSAYSPLSRDPASIGKQRDGDPDHRSCRCGTASQRNRHSARTPRRQDRRRPCQLGRSHRTSRTDFKEACGLMLAGLDTMGTHIDTDHGMGNHLPHGNGVGCMCSIQSLTPSI